MFDFKGPPINEQTSMEKIQDLYTQLLANAMEIDMLSDNIDRLEQEKDLDALENLFRTEFLLYMEHIGIYEDLSRYIDNEPRTAENEFELARIRRDKDNLLRITVVDI